MRRGTKPADLRLRPVDGLLEDVVLAVPVEWMESLRVQADKLGLPVEGMVVQYLGHLVAQVEALEKAVESPVMGDDPMRFLLRGSFQKTFEAEALRCGLPVRVVLHRVVADAADAFEGRPKAPMAKPLSLVAKRRKWLRR